MMIPKRVEWRRLVAVAILLVSAWLGMSANLFAAEFSFKPFLQFRPLTADGTGTISFEAARSGDFNGDGLQDVACLVYDNSGLANEILVYKNRGGPVLALPSKYVLPNPGVDLGLGVADVNEDGVDDLVVGETWGFAVLVSNGQGGMNWVEYNALQYYYFNLRPTDFNHDGHLDLVGTGYNANTQNVLHVFLGNGRGGFSAPIDTGVVTGSYKPVGADMQSVDMVDYRPIEIAGDGIDLAVGFNISTMKPDGTIVWSGLLRLLRTDHNANQLPEVRYSALINFEEITTGDFNSDGREDLLTGGFQLWPQSASGSLSPSYTLSIPNIPRSGFVASDLDGDGHEEFMTLHQGWSTYGYYLQRNHVLTGEYGDAWLLPGENVSRDALAVGDFFGDHCRDAAVANDYDGFVLLPGQDCRLPEEHEFVIPKTLDADANGRSDLLTRDLPRHRIVTAYMSGTTRVASSSHAIGDGYRLVATGDFNRDKHTDLLWSSSANDLLMSLGSGNGYVDQLVSLRFASGWSVLGAVDINHDGKDDILLRNAASGKLVVWYMSGATRTAYSSRNVDPAYTFAGSGDFDGDGRQDVAWTSALRDVLIDRNTTAGFRIAAIGINYSPDYRLAGVSDIDGDGHADLLLRSKRLGRLVTWFMKGTARRAYSSKAIGGAYRLVGKGDFNGDHRGDLVWANDAHQTLFSLSNGPNFDNYLSPESYHGTLMDAR